MTTFIFLSTLTLTGNQVVLGLLGVAAVLCALVVGVKLYWKQQHSLYQEESKDLSSLTKKYSAVDVRQHGANIKLLSLATAIGAVFIIFAWTHYSHETLFEGNGLLIEGLSEDVPVTTHEPPQQLPALPPPVMKSLEFEEVELEPIVDPEPVVDLLVDPTTGPNDGKAAPSFGNTEIVIEPEPEPLVGEEVPPETVWAIAEQMPRFPGCEAMDGDHVSKKKCADQKMLSYIYQHVRYPNQAREVGVEGIAVVSFVVDRAGKIQDIKLVRDPGAGLGKEAVRIVRKMNELPEAWTPGKQRGRTVKVLYNLPIRFTLN